MLLVNKLCILLFEYCIAPCKFTFNCKVFSEFHKILTHFNVKIKTPDIALFFKEESASSDIT